MSQVSYTNDLTVPFPKLVFLDWLTPDDTCARCHQPL